MHDSEDATRSSKQATTRIESLRNLCGRLDAIECRQRVLLRVNFSCFKIRRCSFSSLFKKKNQKRRFFFFFLQDTLFLYIACQSIRLSVPLSRFGGCGRIAVIFVDSTQAVEVENPNETVGTHTAQSEKKKKKKKKKKAGSTASVAGFSDHGVRRK